MSTPNDKFAKEQIALIKKHFDAGELFGDEGIVAFVKEHFDPDAVFDDLALESWALKHGFIKDPRQTAD